MKFNVRSLVVGGATALAMAGLSLIAAGGGAALAAGGGGPTPPWESSINPAPFGTITFYNAQGQVVTGGSISASGLAAYAVASSADPRSGDDKATLYAYTPVSGENPGTWSGTNLGPATTYPVASAPSAITTSNPTESDTGGLDEAFETYINTFPNNDTSTDGYSGLFDIRMEVSGPGIGQEAGYWDTVISVDITAGTLQDPTAGTWSVDYPDYTQNTTTTLSATPASPQTAPASPITLNANVSPATAGSVSFWSGYGTSSATQVGTTQTVTASSGAASVTTTPPTGTTAYTAVYTPAIGSSDIGSVSSALNYSVTTPLDVTTTTLGETGGGGAAGTPVNFTATVADTTTPADTPTGTVSFYDNGSTTPLGTAALTDGTATFSYTYATAGSHSVVATYVPTASSQWAGSTSTAVTFSETAAACTTCTDVQTIEGTVPAGTLAVYTPYTATNPLNLGTLALNANGTEYSASASLDSNPADVPTAGADPDTTFNGITVVDTQAGNLPWTVTALSSALGDGGSNPGSTISAENVGLTGLAAVPVPGNALTAGDLTFTDAPAASPAVAPTDTGSQGLGGATPHLIVTDAGQAVGTIGINGTVTLNAPTSTEAGLFVGTITFTIAS
jgi:Bacterial Ig-like domain (group 3)